MAYLKYDGTVAAVSGAVASNIYSKTSVETLTGTDRAEAIWGGAGDTLVGGLGNDSYYLQANNITVVEQPGGGVDTVVAWRSLSLTGFSGIENIKVIGDGLYVAGDAFDNVVQGAEGGQQIYGGLGQDYLLGGAEDDVFIVRKGEGNDVIGDFTPSEDVVRLTAGLTDFAQVAARLSQRGADVHLDLGGGDGLIFRNLNVGDLSSRNFQLELPAAYKTQQTFSEEFSGPLSYYDKAHAPGGLWRTDYGYSGQNGAGSYSLTNNSEKQIYTSPYFRDHPGDFSEIPFVSNPDGTLSIWARPSSNPEIFGYGYTSGLITTKDTWSQTYGYFEMRADLPDAKGAWPAFWLLPANGKWPPELDIMESLGDARLAYTTEHSSVGGHTQSGQSNFTPDGSVGFHTYGAVWSPQEIVWYIDNVEVFRADTPSDMHSPMFILANMALGGWAGTIDNAALPAEMKIDYIRAWALPASVGNGITQQAVSATGEVLRGGVGDDVLTGGAGPDTLDGGVSGANRLWGAEGNDLITGGAGFDNIHGNIGNDTASGAAGDDWVVGGQGDDLLMGDAGFDAVYGNLGNDTCHGGDGADWVRGGQGADSLTGGAGNDLMWGDRGNDTLSGGAGADTFYTFGEGGIDRVLDFKASEGDRVRIEGDTWTVSGVGADTVITLSGGAQLVLAGVSASSFSTAWVI